MDTFGDYSALFQHVSENHPINHAGGRIILHSGPTEIAQQDGKKIAMYKNVSVRIRYQRFQIWTEKNAHFNVQLQTNTCIL